MVNGSDRVIIKTSDGFEYVMYHSQDCCEGVSIEDVAGDFADLIGSPILEAEEVSNKNENPEGTPVKEYQESWTWTFYKLSTIKGSVTLRWYGESNGYYSESVDFCLLSEEGH
jgi:hypothetical protein